MKNNVVSEIKSGVKLSIKVIAVLIIAAVIAFVYVRTHPRWQETEVRLLRDILSVRSKLTFHSEVV